MDDSMELVVFLLAIALGFAPIILHALRSALMEAYEDEAAATRAQARNLLRLAVRFAVETGATWIWRDKRDGANVKGQSHGTR